MHHKAQSFAAVGFLLIASAIILDDWPDYVFAQFSPCVDAPFVTCEVDVPKSPCSAYCDPAIEGGWYCAPPSHGEYTNANEVMRCQSAATGAMACDPGKLGTIDCGKRYPCNYCKDMGNPKLDCFPTGPGTPIMRPKDALTGGPCPKTSGESFLDFQDSNRGRLRDI